MGRSGSNGRRRRRRDAPLVSRTAVRPPQGTAGPPLSAAGFIAQLRGGTLADAGRMELVDGMVRWPERLSATAALAVTGLEARLLAEVGRVRQPGAPQLLAGPLLRLGPYLLLRPALALTAEPQHPGMTPLLGESTGVEGLLLVVEVQQQRAVAHQRLAHYAAAAVREAWLLDLSGGYTEAYRSPWAGRYHSRTLWYPGEAVPVSALQGVAVVALTDSW